MCIDIEGLLINLVYIAALIAIVRLLVPWVLSKFGGDFAIIGAVINIIIWAAIVIFVIYIVFGMLHCLGGGWWPHRF